jgi:hypothetical protein
MFIETPLERLRLDTELVRSVQHDPDLVRKLARSSFRTILSINHPDVGGDGSFVDEASDAMAEINGATNEDLGMIVGEFFAIRDSEDEGIERDRVKRATALLETEKARRIAETEALLTCAYAEKPTFSKAVIELGITPYRGQQPYTTGSTEEELSLMVGSEDSPKPKFVIINNDLDGHIMEVGDSRGSFDFDSQYIDLHKNGSASVRGSDANARTGNPITRQLKLSPAQQWAQNDAVLLGMIERQHVEPAEDLGTSARRQQLPRSRLENGREFEPSWEAVSRTPWLEHMTPVSTHKNNLENKYVVVAKPQASQVAILGLCRKLAS